jgi:hypothetical protein
LRLSPDRISVLESQVSALKEEADRLRAQITELKRHAMECDGLLGIAEEALLLRREQADHLNRELAARQHAIDAILRSRSWKLSLPLRAASTMARRIERLIKRHGNAPAAGGPETHKHPPEAPSAPGHGLRYVHRVTDRVDANKLAIKAIAFYLQEPCDWTRIIGAAPRYFGHYQPRLPDESGSYDPRQSGVIREQTELARQYGIYGFCFHHSPKGDYTLEPPLRRFLSDSDVDFNFCLCLSPPVSISQASWKSLAPAFSDRRYIRIDGKPLLIVYLSGFQKDDAGNGEHLRTCARKAGLPELYLVMAGAGGAGDPRPFDFDAGLDLHPHQWGPDEASAYSLTDPNFTGRIYNYAQIAEKSDDFIDRPFVRFKTVMPGWDEEASRPGAGDSLAGANPALYAGWLEQSCRRTLQHRPEERLIFIKAWNAWPEGAYLEPDRKFGYAYLHASANVLRQYHNDPETRKLIEDLNTGFRRVNDAAIVLHCHYEELIGPIFDQYLSRIKDADLIVTVRNDIRRNVIEEVCQRVPNVLFLCHENRGRDIRPFLFALRRIEELGYTIACKVHTKKAPHSEGRTGEMWRQELMKPLLGSEDSVAKAADIFAQEPDAGLLAPKGSVMDLRINHVHVRNTYWLDRLLHRMGRSDLAGRYTFNFPAGSMYWFRVSALAGFADLILAEDDFEPELGQVDGALHHAVERLVGLYAEKQGYRMKEFSS